MNSKTMKESIRNTVSFFDSGKKIKFRTVHSGSLLGLEMCLNNSPIAYAFGEPYDSLFKMNSIVNAILNAFLVMKNETVWNR